MSQLMLQFFYFLLLEFGVFTDDIDGESVGQNIASFYGMDEMLVKNYGISKAFHTDFVAEELLAENGMSVENLFNEIKEFVK